MTSNARESIGVPRVSAFPNRKHAKTETEMNDMKQLLPSLILAFSVCTGCRTGTIQPERKTTSSVPSAPTTHTAKFMCNVANSGSQSQSSVASAPTTQTAKLMCDIANSGSQSQSSISVPFRSLDSTSSGLSEALATSTEANSEAASITDISPSESLADSLIDAVNSSSETPGITSLHAPTESLTDSLINAVSEGSNATGMTVPFDALKTTTSGLTKALTDAVEANSEAPTISIPLESLDSTSRE